MFHDFRSSLADNLKQKSKSDTDIPGSWTMDSAASTDAYNQNFIYKPGQQMHASDNNDQQNTLQRRGQLHDASTSTVSTILGVDAMVDLENGKVRPNFFDSGFGSDRVTSGVGTRGRTRTVTVSERPGSTTATTTASASPQEYSPHMAGASSFERGRDYY